MRILDWGEKGKAKNEKWRNGEMNGEWECVVPMVRDGSVGK